MRNLRELTYNSSHCNKNTSELLYSNNSANKGKYDFIREEIRLEIEWIRMNLCIKGNRCHGSTVSRCIADHEQLIVSERNCVDSWKTIEDSNSSEYCA